MGLLGHKILAKVYASKLCFLMEVNHCQVVSDIKMDNIPTWFIGARMNFAENLLKYRDDHLAIIATGTS